MLERALSKTFANFFTLFLVACFITIPVHVVQAYVFRDVLAVKELAPEIESFPEGRQVRSVARGDLDAEGDWSLIAIAVEVLLLPVIYRAARHVMAVADEGGVPGALDAYRNLGRAPPTKGVSSPAALAGGAIFAVACAVIVWRIGTLVSDMFSAEIRWAATALTRAGAIATALALAAGSAAALARSAGGDAPARDAKFDVY